MHPHLESCDMCNHVGQKCIAGDVEGHPEAHITRALVQLARQLAVTHVELAQSVAGWQSHAWQVCGRDSTRFQTHISTVGPRSHLSCITFGVPGTHEYPPVVWIRVDGVNDLLQLVHALSFIICQRSVTFEYEGLQQMEN